jgi:hypothetical protein
MRLDMLCESFINYTQTSPLQEHPTRGTTPIASLRAHAAGRLTLKCGGQHGPRAVLPQRPQSLREQRAVGFLEDLSQGVNSQWVHMFPSLTPSECPRTRPGVQRPDDISLAPRIAPGPLLVRRGYRRGAGALWCGGIYQRTV